MSKTRFLAPVILVAYIAGLALVSLGDKAHASAHAVGATHFEGASCPEGSPCPGEGHEDHPCGPSCACSCSPGHAPTLASATVRFALWAPQPIEIDLPPPANLLPKDIVRRIFHPPRA
ncbi:MAG: hypothetical protein MUC50_09860 [Myxococcota bacterium]|nr:hypothetical protein [Myxococcota bacterium]